MPFLPPFLPPLPISEPAPPPHASDVPQFDQWGSELPKGTLVEPIPTYVTVLEDVEASSSADEYTVDKICLPLLKLTKGGRIEVMDRYSEKIWIGIVNGGQGPFKLDENVRPVFDKYVRALYSWTPLPDEDGLAFSQGDLIEVGSSHKEWTWWIWGRLNGRIGVVPFNFVEPVKVVHSDSDGSATDQGDPSQAATDSLVALSLSDSQSTEPTVLKVKALYDYRGGSNLDLNFRRGDIIVVVRKEHNGWWEGILHSRQGVFPKNYVTFNTTPNDSDEPTPPVLRVHPPWQPYYVRTIYPYQARADDELSFSPGEIIEVYDMAMTPWWEGRKRNGDRGLFPTNFTNKVMDRRTPTSKLCIL